MTEKDRLKPGLAGAGRQEPPRQESPRQDLARPEVARSNLLVVENLRVHYRLAGATALSRAKVLRAVEGLSFAIPRRGALGLVGESGSGKSTAAKAVMRLTPASGRAWLDGTDLLRLDGRALRAVRPRLQMVFQDPFSSLNPRRRALEAVREPMDLNRLGPKDRREERAAALLAAVGLPPDSAKLFPHQFSGGQRQRLMIARALATSPELLICDEPVSALDVAVQAQILNLLAKLQAELGLTMLFISHDLGVVQRVCRQVAVMHLGRLMELGPREEIFALPAHPYTWALLSAAMPGGPLRASLRRVFKLTGEAPGPFEAIEGCAFSSRCPLVRPFCRRQAPPPLELGRGRVSACHLASETAELGRSLVGGEIVSPAAPWPTSTR
ncbi:MAG: ABC transporter ATP-binding protein, partial [Deltaproteobacteria bacterium]|nr:ABC transporter ATP-binding protein [Deltaproteobacteria bacterium]